MFNSTYKLSWDQSSLKLKSRKRRGARRISALEYSVQSPISAI